MSVCVCACVLRRLHVLKRIHQALQKRIVDEPLDELLLRYALIFVDVEIFHDRVGAVLVGELVRLLFAHAEQLEHGMQNEENLRAIDRAVPIDIVDVECVTEFIFQRCFGGGDICHEELGRKQSLSMSISTSSSRPIAAIWSSGTTDSSFGPTHETYLGKSDAMVIVRIERPKDVFTEAFDVFVGAQRLVELAELLFGHRRRAGRALLLKALLPGEDVLSRQLSMLAYQAVDVIFEFGLICAHAESGRQWRICLIPRLRLKASQPLIRCVARKGVCVDSRSSCQMNNRRRRYILR